MSRAFRILVATALVALASFAFSVSSAGAATDVAICGFSGLAGTASPDGAGTGVQSVQTDINDGGADDFATDFDTGNYTFDGPATCVVRDAANAANNGVQPATIHSEGDYNNQICGTGTAESTPGQAGDADADTTTVTFTGPGTTVGSVDYQISFFGGNGALTIDSATAPSGNVVSGGGFVHITPAQGQGNCATIDVTAFDVAGAFAVRGGTPG